MQLAQRVISHFDF